MADGTDSVAIRPAEPGDLPELVRIDNHYVRETCITFDTRPFTQAGRRPWFDAFAATGPHRLLVAACEGRPVGYASSGTFRSKPAYARSVETTIYLDPGWTGRGLGRRLYGALLDALRSEPDVHRACAGITLPNPASLALHERLGFRPVGTYHEVGFKHGRYWDVHWLEKQLDGDPAAGSEAASVADELRGLEERLLDPAVRASPERLDEILEPRFGEIGSSGRVLDKASVLASLRDAPAATLALEDFRVETLSPDVALASYRTVPRADAPEGARASLRSSVWVRRDGRWRIRFHQGTPLERS